MKIIIFVVTLFTFIDIITAKITPIINISLLTGQSTFEGKTSGFSGYLDGNLSFPFRFSYSTTLLPIVNLKYSGFKEVEELLGGGTLYQETFDTFLVIKLIQKLPNDFYLKPKIILKHEAIKETKEETWKSGLYNYTRSGAGLEFSKNFNKKNTLSFGINLSKIVFPNYTSVAYESRELLGAEYSINAATRPLDYNSVHIYVENELKVSKNLTLKVSLNSNTKNFIEQSLVIDGPQYTEEKRKDQSVHLNLGVDYLSMHFKNSFSNIGVYFTLSKLDSNQNHFYIDPDYPKFIKDFYDYTTIKLSLPFKYTFPIGEKTSVLTLVLSSERKNYTQRPTQDATTGEFLEEKVYINYNVLIASFEYRLTNNFSIKTIFNFYKSQSNMKYEKVYRYNYSGGYYLLGITYRY
ncbi:MAG: hypothetical protein N2505_01790 [Endomicrobia bacterium]|nr:hypothetical protein [Endomicrobiia bacterium]